MGGCKVFQFRADHVGIHAVQEVEDRVLGLFLVVFAIHFE